MQAPRAVLMSLLLATSQPIGTHALEPPSAFTLASGGKPATAIYIRGNLSSFAASELMMYTQKLSGGAQLRVLQEGEHGASSGVFVGNTSQLALDFPKFDPASSVGGEGYAHLVTADARRLFIVGDDRCLNSETEYGRCRMGTTYGVYGLLRDSLGVRWLWPGESGELIPPPDAAGLVQIPLSKLNSTSSPALRYRNLRPAYNARWGADYYQPLASITGYTEQIRQYNYEREMAWKLRMMNGAHDTPSGGEGMTARLWSEYQIKRGSYQSSHPGYFALLPNSTNRGPVNLNEPKYTHMCVSNSSLQRTIVDRAMPSLLDGGFSVSSVDDDGGDGFCTCSKCRALDRAHALPVQWDGSCTAHGINSSTSALSERYVHFNNALSDQVKQRLPNRSDIWTIYYAYECYKDPPVSGLKLRPNTLASLTTFNSYPRANTSGLCADPPCLTDRERWMGWYQAGARGLVVRPNSLYYLGYGMPFDASQQLTEDFQFCGDNRLLGADFDSLIGDFSTVGPTYYVLARLMWQPSSNASSIRKIEDEYFLAFGSAAVYVREYWDLWRNFTINTWGGNRATQMRQALGGESRARMRIASQVYSSQLFGQAAGILEKAAATVLSAEAGTLDRIRFLSTGLEHGRLTFESYAAVNSSLCTKGATLQYPVGWNSAYVCDVRNVIPAARRMLAFRFEAANTSAVNVYWASHAEIACGDGCSGVTLAGEVNNLPKASEFNPLLTLSSYQWWFKFDPTNEGIGLGYWNPATRPYKKYNFTFEISTLRNWTSSDQDADWRRLHNTSFTGTGWYISSIRCPHACPPMSITGGKLQYGLAFSSSTGPIQAWLDGTELPSANDWQEPGDKPLLFGPFEASSKLVSSSVMIAARVSGNVGLDGRVWLVQW